MTTDANITYRWIDGPIATDSDWDLIESVLAERGWTSLNRQTTRILVAEDEGKLAGFLVLQLFPHLEPLYVDKDHRATGLAEELSDRMIKFMTEAGARGWISIADSPHAEALCKREGMTLVKSKVYKAG